MKDKTKSAPKIRVHSCMSNKDYEMWHYAAEAECWKNWAHTYKQALIEIKERAEHIQEFGYGGYEDEDILNIINEVLNDR